MSGIVGLLRTDGAPVERELIGRLTQSLAFRGPDAQQTWTEGPVAFGHTLLRTTDESENEHQPFTLDGQVWIVADCRVDARGELIEKLGGPSSLLRVPDVELILRAYLRWGESCVEHLLGDFAFGIWDGRTHRLFCARDHMGVKPFYYAHVGPWLIFSNTLDCVRLHPAVSDKLNDLAIADFVLFGGNQEPDTTSFADIQRVTPAYTMTCVGSSLDVRRYWTLPIEEPIYYRRDQEYIDQFQSLLKQAVSDRLRTGRVSVFMSGGLDSPALAATAVALLKNPRAVHAFTLVFDRLIPDGERHFAGLVAEHLGIPIEFFALDQQTDWAPSDARITPEPVRALSDPEPRNRCHAAMAAHSRVALFGEGPDNALEYEWRPHLAWLRSQNRWGRLLLDLGKHICAHRRIPLLPTVPRMLRERRNSAYWTPIFPQWLNPALVERLQLKDRWVACRTRLASRHPVKPKAYASLDTTLWPSLFEGLEPPSTCVALEVRHPYLDLRLLSYLLRVPALPWCREKNLMRLAMHTVLPEAVRLRPKTALATHPDYVQAGIHGMPAVLPSESLAVFGDIAKLPDYRPESVAIFHLSARFAALSQWLDRFVLTTSSRTTGEKYEFHKGEKYELAEDMLSAGSD